MKTAVLLLFIVLGIASGVTVPKPKGRVIDRVPIGLSKIEGVDIWALGDADDVVVLLPDINGLSDNLKGITANISKEFTAIVIDYFNGNITNRPPYDVAIDYAKRVVANLYKRGYPSIQAQGYCFGGKVGVALCSAPEMAHTCVVAHPSSLVNNDALYIIKPMFFEMPAVDTFNSMAPYYNTTLRERGIPAEFKIYPNTTHGFAVSGTNPLQKQICLQDSINWFNAHK